MAADCLPGGADLGPRPPLEVGALCPHDAHQGLTLARLATPQPASKTGTENSNDARHERELAKRPDGATTSGVNNAVTEGRFSFQASRARRRAAVSRATTTATSSRSADQLAVGHRRRGHVEGRFDCGIHGAIGRDEDAEGLLRPADREPRLFDPRLVGGNLLFGADRVQSASDAPLEALVGILEVRAGVVARPLVQFEHAPLRNDHRQIRLPCRDRDLPPRVVGARCDTST